MSKTLSAAQKVALRLEQETAKAKEAIEPCAGCEEKKKGKVKRVSKSDDEQSIQ